MTGPPFRDPDSLDVSLVCFCGCTYRDNDMDTVVGRMLWHINDALTKKAQERDG